MQTATRARQPIQGLADGPAIAVQNLVKTYGSLRAVDDLSFSVQSGEIFALLGPNGAGKTVVPQRPLVARSPCPARAWTVRLREPGPFIPSHLENRMNVFRSHPGFTRAASLLLVGAGCLTMNGTDANAAPVAQAARVATAQALVLSAAEVRTVTGATFRMTGTSVTNAQVSMGEHVPTATVRRYRIDGYSSSFRRGASRGVISVTDSVGRYRSVAGARWQFGVLKRLNPPPPHSTMLRLVGLGDRASGYIVGSPYLGAVAIIFRRGHYTGRVNVEQIGGKPIAAALRLAHILDAHLQSAG